MTIAEGFPIVYCPTDSRLFVCRLCVEPFWTDGRAAPVLAHPELGAVIVYYQCAGCLRREHVSP